MAQLVNKRAFVLEYVDFIFSNTDFIDVSQATIKSCCGIVIRL